MGKIIEHYETIVRELARISVLDKPWNDPASDDVFPRMLALNDGGQLFISAGIDRAIQAVARRYRNEKPAIGKQYSARDWGNLVRRAFAAPLAGLELTLPIEENAQRLRFQLNDIMADLHGREENVETFSFGASWAQNKQDAFRLGPAVIETREAWLKRLHEEGAISAITHSRVSKLWKQEKLHKRKPSREASVEQDIVNTVDDWPHVISVTIAGVSLELMQDRAVRIARLSLAVTALMWETPSRALRGLNLGYDDLPARSVVLHKHETGFLGASYFKRAWPVGQSISEGKWKELEAQFKPMLVKASAVAQYIAGEISPTACTIPVRKLDVALRWFYDGCRASDHLMGITHFAACLDTIAEGKKECGILRFFETVCGISGDTIIHLDGFSLSSVVKAIYADARSRFLHGNTERHLDDWAEYRNSAEVLCRRALIALLFDEGRTVNADDAVNLHS